jgi:hypothetical protein
MSFARWQKYKELYVTLLPVMSIYSTITGVNAGLYSNRQNPERRPIDTYATLIGYGGIGILTGITYPISFPLCGCYVFYKSLI